MNFVTRFGAVRRSNASEMDSALVNAVLRLLNEKSEQELNVSGSFASPAEAEPFDVKGFQAWKDQQRFNTLSDYEKQQEILFEAKGKQLNIEWALEQRNEELLAIQKFEGFKKEKGASNKDADVLK